MEKLSFTDWIMKHTKRNSPLGDLASDINSDDNWPEKIYDIEYLQHLVYYIWYKASWDGPKDALRSAINSYKNYVSTHNLNTPYLDIADKLSFEEETEGMYIDLIAQKALRQK